MPSASCICGKTSLAYPADQVQMKLTCHCLTCRKLSGTTHIVCAMVPDSAVEQTGAAPRVTHGTHETGMNFEFFGCKTCPSTLYKTADGFPGAAFVFLGAVDDEQEGVGQKPGGEIWTKYRVGWLHKIDGSAQFDEFPPAN